LDFFSAANPLECLVYKNPKDFGLRPVRHVSDFIEVDHTAVSLFQ
jgi:hypothetical protein